MRRETGQLEGRRCIRLRAENVDRGGDLDVELALDRLDTRGAVVAAGELQQEVTFQSAAFDQVDVADDIERARRAVACSPLPIGGESRGARVADTDFARRVLRDWVVAEHDSAVFDAFGGHEERDLMAVTVRTVAAR